MDQQAKTGDRVVLDTNIVLDLLVFNDGAAAPLKQALQDGALDWISTQAMRDELERVLAYPQIVPRLALNQLQADDVLAAFDRHVRLVDAAARAPVTCSDADDQIYIDLAIAHQAWLISKDRAILSMQKRLLALGVRAQAAIKNIAI